MAQELGSRLQEPDVSTPLGHYHGVWLGYSASEEIRKNAASGGIVTGILEGLFKRGDIDGALVCRSEVENGQMKPKIYIAQSSDELRKAQTSKYYDIPVIQGLKAIQDFQGKVAVVGLPSQITAITRRMQKSSDLEKKIHVRIAIFCGHNSKEELLQRVLAKRGIRMTDVEQFFFRKGLWRGKSVVRMKDGSEIQFPFQEFSHYQNLHILSLDRCLNCFDHMGYYSDISTGDVWLGKEKKSPIKKSIFLSRTERGHEILQSLLKEGDLVGEATDRRTLYRSQKRSINYHYNQTARARLSKFFGIRVVERIDSKPRFRDYLAAVIVLTNHMISKNEKLLALFMKLPKVLIRGYVYLFKGLTHYERKEI